MGKETTSERLDFIWPSNTHWHQIAEDRARLASGANALLDSFVRHIQNGGRFSNYSSREEDAWDRVPVLRSDDLQEPEPDGTEEAPLD